VDLTVAPVARFDASHSDAATAALIAYCHELNVRTIPVPLPRNDDGTFDFRTTAEVVRRLAAEGIKPAIAHGPGDPPIALERLDDDARARHAVNEQAAENIRRLGEAGVPALVMFCRLPRGDQPATRQQSWDIVLAAFEAMTAAAQNAGVFLAAHGLHDTALHNYEEERALVDAIPSAHLGICYDPIHSSINGHTVREGGDYLSPIALLKDRITYVHIRDMAMSKELDKPIELPIGEGMIDELAVLQGLHAIAYQGVAQIEHMPTELVYARSLGYLRGLVRAGVK
jgi:sugar phosphate isomerase/epimerase